MQSDFFMVINLIGVFVFAFTGSMRAIQEKMDILGIITLGVVTALGGGIIRDMLVNKVPYALSAFPDMAVSLLGVAVSILVFIMLRRDVSNTYFIQIPDALGLAVFTVTGALVAHSMALSVFGWIILATTTAVGGGLLGDLFCCRIPLVLKEGFYASCSVVGTIIFYVLIINHIDLNLASLVGCVSVFVMRMFAIYYNWHLPRIVAEKITQNL